MFFSKVYNINEWTKWDDILFDSINDFYKSFSFKPNILQANEHTFSQFDFLTNVRPEYKQNATRRGKKPGENEEVKLSGFECSISSLDFAIDDQLPDKEFRLVYDDEAEWDNPEEIYDVPEDVFEIKEINIKG